MRNILGKYINQNYSFLGRLNRWISAKWCQAPIIDRWLTLEILSPLLFAIAAFTVVSLSVGVMFELVRKIVES